MKLLREYAREIMTSQVDPGNVDLHICGRKISVELATTNETRNRGLMHRHSLDADSGMLFVFPNIDYRSFWMENTYIPLSIAYLTEAGQIINIERMHPFNRASVKSRAPAKYALETNSGWFKKNGISAGDCVEGLPSFAETVIREQASSRQEVPEAQGDCYEAAGRYVMQECMFGNDDCELILAHGEVMGQGPIEGIPFGHAWVEQGNSVIDKSNGRDINVPTVLYYAIGRINELDNVIRYPWSEAKQKILEHETWGPWDLETSSGY
jgi:uncharacterized membrane protein (UPF0127 family)